MSGKVIAVTAGKGGAGKSSVASMLGWASVRLGLRTVLFDLNVWNQDQFARQRVAFGSVPGRMPTVLDDTFPQQWWADSTSGLQIVPGPRSSAQRRPEVVLTPALRLIDRARRDRDVTVLDMRQYGSDAYTSLLVSAADVVVAVCDADAGSRSNLRTWLDQATMERSSSRDDEFVPELDPNEIRLVYVEHAGLGGGAKRYATAQAEMGTAYQWAGVLPFDPSIVDGGNAGELFVRAKRDTLVAGLRLTAAVLGVEVPADLVQPPRRGLFRRAVMDPLRVAPRPAAPAPREQAKSSTAIADAVPAQLADRPDDGHVRLQVLGVPALAGPTVDDATLAAITLVALAGPMTIGKAAARLGWTEQQTLARLASAPGVRVDDGLAMRAPGLRVDVDDVRFTADQIAEGQITAVAHGVELLGQVSANVMPNSHGNWSWVAVETSAREPSQRAQAITELLALATGVAGRVELVDRATVVRELLRLALGLAGVSDPTPLLVAAATATDDPAVNRLLADAQRHVAADPTNQIDLIRDLIQRVNTRVAVDQPPMPADHPAMPPGLDPEPPRLTVVPDRPVVPLPTAVSDPAPVPTTPTFSDPPPVLDPPAAPVPASGVELLGGSGLSPTGAVEPVITERVAPASPVLTVVPAPVVAPARPAASWDVLLRTCGEVAVVGHERPKTGLMIPFILAAFGRPVGVDELKSMTGKTSFRNGFPAGSRLVVRDGSHWLIADGVWTDTGWMVHAAGQADEALHEGAVDVADKWCVVLLEQLDLVKCSPYAQAPSGWDWVDEYPYGLPARQAASMELVSAALDAARLVKHLSPRSVRLVDVAATLCKIAEHVPVVPSRRGPDRPFANSGHALLHAAAGLTTGDPVAARMVEHAVRTIENVHRLSDVDDITSILDRLNL